MTPGENLSWEEYRYHLTSELTRMSNLLDKISGQVGEIQNKQLAAETRAKTLGSMYGLIAGAIPIGLKILWTNFFHGKN